MTKLLATDGEGDRLGRFELIAELASGGMATVYLARLSGVAGFQRLVAIKRLHPHLAKEPEFIEMFLDEARLAARIHHPNVVPIQEVGESEHGGYYLVMDYVEGDTLAHLLARAAQGKIRVPWGVTIRILLDVLWGLHAAHELRDDLGELLHVVHRDVSPQNVLVGIDGISRITDFGVARAASRLSTTRSGQLKGKLAYMAPEQARGEPVDRRADIFSCGIVLWEALALRRLFKGDGEAETLNRVLYDPIQPPSSVTAEVPKDLEEVCMRALSRDVGLRFHTAQDFADELEQAARRLSYVGSGRDVASCLEDVVGVDLTKQREAVRSWLARSEPNGSPRSRPTFPSGGRGLSESSKTRIEGEISKSKRLSNPPPHPEHDSDIDRLAITAPALPDARSVPPDRVSSVSSAVLPLVRADASASLAVEVRPRSRTPIFAGAAAVLAVVAALGWAATWWTSRHPPVVVAAPAVTSAAIAPAPSAAPEPAPEPRVAAAAPPPVVSTQPSPTRAPRTGTKSKHGAAKPAPSVTAPAAPGPAAADDLSKNPYR